MKLTADGPFADPERAARKLLEIANSLEPYMDQRLLAELINAAFLEAGGSPAEYKAGMDLAITRGWFWRHMSGAYFKLTQAGADLFT
jgi:hypothetical protein